MASLSFQHAHNLVNADLTQAVPHQSVSVLYPTRIEPVDVDEVTETLTL